MEGHFIEKCVGCDAVVSQCRCPDFAKTERKGVCGACRAKWIFDRKVNPEVDKFLSKVYPNEER